MMFGKHSTWEKAGPLAYGPEYQGSSTHEGLSTYQIYIFWGKVIRKVLESDMYKATCPSLLEEGHKNQSTRSLKHNKKLEINV